MLFSRGRAPGGPPLRVVPAGASGDSEPAPKVAVRSRVYEVDPSRGWGGPAEGAGRTPRDLLLSVMRDRRYHPVGEVLGAGVSLPELCAAVAEMVASGYAFDRSRDHLRLRMRGSGESRQDASDLVRGLAEPVEVEVAAGSSDLSATSGGFDPSTDVPDAGGGVVEEGGLELSDPPADLTLPVSGSCARTSFVFAQRGAGKTYLGGVIVEEMVSRPDRYMVVVVDPCGVWWGHLSSSGGTPSRYGFLLLGGQRGARPLGAADGVRAAELVAAVRPRPMILDLSGLAPAEQHEFVADFCGRLMSLPHFPVHVVFDEADEFCPQRLREPGQKRVLAQVERLVMRGRAGGKGATLISLRPAVVSKNVLSQVDSLYLLRLVETNDLRAVGDWLDNFERGISPEQRAACLAQLPVLPSGISYFLQGGERVMFRRFRVRRKHTFDSSKTLTGGASENPVLASPDREVLATLDGVWSAVAEGSR